MPPSIFEFAIKNLLIFDLKYWRSGSIYRKGEYRRGIRLAVYANLFSRLKNKRREKGEMGGWAETAKLGGLIFVILWK
jgi:hypothetical protein